MRANSMGAAHFTAYGKSGMNGLIIKRDRYSFGPFYGVRSPLLKVHFSLPNRFAGPVIS